MIQWMLLSLMFMLNLMFMFINHPLAMGMILMIQTTLISLIITLMNLTYWFSYILFIIFMGGMLVLFIYITSLASNKMFSFSMKLLILSLMNMIMFMFTSGHPVVEIRPYLMNLNCEWFNMHY